MKRSEMVELLNSKRNKMPPGKDLTSSTIISILEQAGMLPPTICYNAVGEYINIEDTDILHDNDVSFDWEPEGEL
jgi:hypothetical protein